ncbi:filamin-A-like, partial [Passer montanus]|uniref:filamin-A-like n=1 Tax=Passer montanus TaxID=9160 RepID=UPI0019612BE0
CTPGAVRAEGRGLQPKGLRVNEVADFKVHTKGGGSGDLKVTVKGPKGLEAVKQKDLGDGTFGVEYFPTVPGNYSVAVTWGGQHVPRRYWEELG